MTWNSWITINNEMYWAKLSGEVIEEKIGPAPWRKVYKRVRVLIANFKNKDHKIKPMIATFQGDNQIRLENELIS